VPKKRFSRRSERKDGDFDSKDKDSDSRYSNRFIFFQPSPYQQINMSSSDPVNEMLERAKPAMGQLSFGGMMGFCR
jgi:hypothetical protein